MFHILVVEDEKDTAEYVKQALELEGMQADIAYDGQEGLAMFRSKEYDLLLLDLQMPKMTGEELLKEIRKENPYIDIIVYTNFERFGDIKKLVNMGINGYVNKGPNADLGELVDMIKGKLEPLDEEDMIRLIKSTDEIK
ncbi:MAG: response regulator [Lachnospiraceae bacterium]|nr:response regulator [Lachnospiraceae bacterium]